MGPLAKHDKPFFIDRYLRLLAEKDLSAAVISDITDYGQALWDSVSRLPKGFCHGDLHCGNMLRGSAGQYWLFDFDAACQAFPAVDMAWMSDDTNYFELGPQDYENTARKLDRFVSGYARIRVPTEAEIRSVYDWIAIKHYDIQATIAQCQGTSASLLEQQHGWLMRWRGLCAQKG